MCVCPVCVSVTCVCVPYKCVYVCVLRHYGKFVECATCIEKWPRQRGIVNETRVNNAQICIYTDIYVYVLYMYVYIGVYIPSAYDKQAYKA